MSLIIAKFWPYLLMIAGAIAGALSLYFKGRSDGKNKQVEKVKDFVIEKVHETAKKQDELNKKSEKIYKKIEEAPSQKEKDKFLSESFSSNPFEK